jgi:opacity protein-like surface antigen
MRKTILAGAVATLAMAGPAAADNFSYNILELGLVATAVDDQGGDLDTEGGGLSLGASVEFTPNVFGFLNLSGATHDLKYYDESFDIGQGGLGIGFNLPLAQSLDLVSGVSLQTLRMETDFDTFSGSGYGLNVGLRGGGGRLEWNVGLEYVDIDFDLPDGEAFSASDTLFKAGFRYKFTQLFALGVDVAGNGDDETRGILAFRWNFNDRN